MSASLSSYRTLLRAARMAFQEDVATLAAARSSIRQGFLANAAVEPSSAEFAAKVKHAQEVAAILRMNVVQGKKEGDVYKLRIHEHTERGDNDTVKLAGTDGGKCCSS
ncbi:hypothetical protein F4802DRAFT_288502 [Xylaria palmicola]|nr:hypothetical protein F4802DRAFT_288502 [Xylaria palmicola]